MSQQNGHKLDPDWWRQATVYQIYPRSFSDANGDGIGDLKGITNQVPYLQKLGVDAVWLSPFYPSPLDDGGYDVSDYRNVDPRIGTLEDFDEMVKKFKEVGIRVIVDIVPNHCSTDHVWFQEALKAGRGSKERERFVFRDGSGPDGSEPPSDWEAVFGGSAWERVEDGQYYLHLFTPSQPDFDWHHPDVRSDFLETLRFWANRGVAGFRVDVAMGCAKNICEPYASNEELNRISKDAFDGKVKQNGGGHPFWDRDEVHEIYKDWRELFNQYDPPLTAVAEAWVAPHRKHLYASPEGLGQSFSFDMLTCDYAADKFQDCIQVSLDHAAKSGSSTTWVFSNHDVMRHATRFGLDECHAWGGGEGFNKANMAYLLDKASGRDHPCDLDLGLKRARAATLMMLALPGSAYIYQGEELGLPEVVDIPHDKRQDPVYFRKPGKDIGRDGCRVPLPWSIQPGESESYGFSPDKGVTPPHLPAPTWWGHHSVEKLDQDPNSTLGMYRQALALKKTLQGPENLKWIGDTPGGVLHFERPGGWQVIMNVSKEDGVALPSGEVLITSSEVTDTKLPVDTTAWVKI